jgi:hypothetical protein
VTEALILAGLLCLVAGAALLAPALGLLAAGAAILFLAWLTVPAKE